MVKKENRKWGHQNNTGKMKGGTGRGRLQKQGGEIKNIGGRRAAWTREMK
jgi:hypothetical protein